MNRQEWTDGCCRVDSVATLMDYHVPSMGVWKGKTSGETDRQFAKGNIEVNFKGSYINCVRMSA